MAYSIPAKDLETTFEVKKSLFHARAGYAASRDDAMTMLARCKADYPDARHHCWAYLLGNPACPDSAAMSDDGEPSGTAGKPILNVLQHNDVGDVMVVVSRYFGGVKLGAGGLIRAYSAATQQTLNQLCVLQHVERSYLRLQTDFKHEPFFRHLIASLEGTIVNCTYSQTVMIEMSLPDIHVEQILASAANLQAHANVVKKE